MKETRKSKSVTELVHKLPVASTVSDPSLATTHAAAQPKEMAPNLKTPVAEPPAVLSWAQKLKSGKNQQKAVAPAQRNPAQQRAFPGGPPVGQGAEKETEQIKIDPIAKKINDIIYAEDKAEIDGELTKTEHVLTSFQELGVPRGLINQANNCWVNSLLQTALVCEPLYKLLKKLLFYTQGSNDTAKNDKELANIGNDIKRMLPTCSKLAEVFGEMFTKVSW